MNTSLLLAYILAVVVVIGTPGPVVALVINAATRHGFKFALITVLGVNLASLVLLASAALIIFWGITLNEHMLKWISLIGCGFIGWMALNGLRAQLTQSGEKKSEQATPVRRHSGFFNGFFLGVSNPKDIIFFVAFFPQFITVVPDFKLSLGILTLVWMLADFVILLSYALLMRGSFFLQQQRNIALLSSAFLLLIAIFGAVYALFGWQV